MLLTIPAMAGVARSIAWIGTGVMGQHMAAHLMRAGHRLTVFTRTAEKAAALVEAGAQLAESPAEAARGKDAVFLMVGYPSDVEQVVLGEQGVLGAMTAGTVLVDCTTSTPELAQRIWQLAADKGVVSFDAPVSGGDIGAREARLTVFLGGDAEHVDTVKPLLEPMAGAINYMGPAGSGAHAKMANQIFIASTMMSLCEGLMYAKAAGLDPAQVVQACSSGAAGSRSLDLYAGRILSRDWAPGFYVEHYLKDLRVCIAPAGLLLLQLLLLLLRRCSAWQPPPCL